MNYVYLILIVSVLSIFQICSAKYDPIKCQEEFNHMSFNEVNRISYLVMEGLMNHKSDTLLRQLIAQENTEYSNGIKTFIDVIATVLEANIRENDRINHLAKKGREYTKSDLLKLSKDGKVKDRIFNDHFKRNLEIETQHQVINEKMITLKHLISTIRNTEWNKIFEIDKKLIESVQPNSIRCNVISNVLRERKYHLFLNNQKDISVYSSFDLITKVTSFTLSTIASGLGLGFGGPVAGAVAGGLATTISSVSSFGFMKILETRNDISKFDRGLRISIIDHYIAIFDKLEDSKGVCDEEVILMIKDLLSMMDGEHDEKALNFIESCTYDKSYIVNNNLSQYQSIIDMISKKYNWDLLSNSKFDVDDILKLIKPETLINDNIIKNGK
jgi:hypothetical protein